jgi:hypothetical protein
VGDDEMPEIQADLESRMCGVEARISSKQERLEELEDSINGIESKLDDSAHDYCPAAFLRLRFAKISM